MNTLTMNLQRGTRISGLYGLMRRLSSVLLSCAVAQAQASDLATPTVVHMNTASTVPITTHFLMRLHAPLAAPDQLTSTLLVFHPRDGGTVEGPGLHGTVMSPTGDWVRVMPNGNMKIDVRMTLRMDNGDLVFMSYGGILKKPDDASWQRFMNGEAIRAPEWYYVITPVFETASTKYAWLNDVQAVGKFTSIQTGAEAHVSFDVFAVE